MIKNINPEELSEFERHQGRAPLILFASRRVFLIYSLVFALLISGAILAAHKSPINSAILIVIFSLPFCFFSIHAMTNGYRLKITEQGLALTRFSRTQTIRWADMREIRAGWSSALDPVQFGFNKKLFVHYRREAQDRSLIVWPIYFGISAAEMVDCILPYCADYPRLAEKLIADSSKSIVL
jgi:hypothetical protein